MFFSVFLRCSVSPLLIRSLRNLRSLERRTTNDERRTTPKGPMILTKPELIASLQKEVRILVHLAGKVDPAQLDYRPTPKQRSTIELLRYLSYMGPMLVRYAKAEPLDESAWGAIVAAANARDFEQTVAAIEAHTEAYETLVGVMSD